jgi:hypothetical protein
MERQLAEINDIKGAVQTLPKWCTRVTCADLLFGIISGSEWTQTVESESAKQQLFLD